ncbi:MAG: hypothetical protein HKN68_17465 [Saprospiraceae bacterium]|nr:hypothetical protein [Saprospiraceae bacterium]
MKTLVGIITLVMFISFTFPFYGQTLEHLPVKVKTQKVDITLHSEEEIEGYLVDVVKDAVFIVKHKSMVKESIQNGCMTCTRIPKEIILHIALKQSTLNRVVIGGAMLGAGIIWSLGGDDHNPDGISERALRMMTFSIYGGAAIAVAILYNQVKRDDSFDLVALKKKCSKTRFYKKCTDTVREFTLNGRINKTYSFYIGDSFRLVKGKVVKKDIKEVAVIPEYSERQIFIEIKEIKSVK